MQNCVTLMNVMTPGKVDKKSALTMRVANTGGNLSSSSRCELIFFKSKIISFIRTENRPWLVSGQDSLQNSSIFIFTCLSKWIGVLFLCFGSL